MLKQITEGNAILKAHLGKISKDLPVFYNPAMELNRTISVVLLKATQRQGLQIGLPLSGSGIRAIRLMKELDKSQIKKISINDLSKQAIKSINTNLKLNKIPKSKVSVSNREANLFILASKGFDYIDIDPFGSPNPFLDSATRRLARNSILAVTATDTAALCGTHPKACTRKYFAHHTKNPLMHELALRILIRKVQLIASQYDRALTPIFSYSKEHYMRIFFSCQKSKQAVDKIHKQHSFFNEFGPLWAGPLWDKKLTREMIKILPDNKFLQRIAEESQIDQLGFHHIHAICKTYKCKVPSKEKLFNAITKKGYAVSLTHFTPAGIRSEIPKSELIKIIKKEHKNAMSKIN